MTKLSVNVNKIATLRNSRGGDNPNVVQVALDCERFGADGITVHPRPDERHITRKDVLDLSKVLQTEFNIEGYPDDRFLQLIENIRPAQATLVPDPPHVLTSSAGWDVVKNYSFLKDTMATLKRWGVRVSLFMETDLQQIERAVETGTDRIELYTGPYAEQFGINPERAVQPYILAAQKANEMGLGINAGHDLNLNNLKYFKTHIPDLKEVSIGHALITDALYFGLENTIQQYKFQLQE
jgi:pyridoxine 5-phosphate synthase